MNKKGFTLIELLIVVAIIAILAGIVLVGLRPSLDTARDVRRAAELKQLQTALTAYYARYGTSPTNLAAGVTAVGGTVPGALGDAATFDYRYIKNGDSYILGVQFEREVGTSLGTGAFKAATPQPAGSGGGSPLNCSTPTVYCLSGF